MNKWSGKFKRASSEGKFRNADENEIKQQLLVGEFVNAEAAMCKNFVH